MLPENEEKGNYQNNLKEARSKQLENVKDIADLFRNWVEVGSNVRVRRGTVGCPLLVRAKPREGKTWWTKQLMANLSSGAENVNLHS